MQTTLLVECTAQCSPLLVPKPQKSQSYSSSTHRCAAAAKALTICMLNDLQAHPEGGRYAERFRSTMHVRHPKLDAQRAAATLIQFHLQAGEFSAWHRVASEEMWLHTEGDGIELLQWDGAGAVKRQRIGATSLSASTTWAIIPANIWQAARPLGNSELVHCVVAPGFDFADFEMMRDAEPKLQQQLNETDSAACGLI